MKNLILFFRYRVLPYQPTPQQLIAFVLRKFSKKQPEQPKQQPTPQQISAFVLRKFSAPELDLSNLTLDEL